MENPNSLAISEDLNIVKNCKIQTNKVLSVKEIQSLNLSSDDVLNLAFFNVLGRNCHFLEINSVPTVCFSDHLNLRKTVRKIQKMGLGFGQGKQIQDGESLGIIRAYEIGENPFHFKMICANPEMNCESPKYL